MIKIAVVDDELDMLKEITDGISKQFEKRKIKITIDKFTNGAQLIKALESNRLFDVVFLDIELPDKLGLEIAKLLKETYRNIIIAFVTSFDNYVYDAFDYDVIAYIRKQEFEIRLSSVIDRVIKKYKEMFNKKLFKNAEGQHTVATQDIVYFESCDHSITIYENNEFKFEITDSLKNLEDEYYVHGFFRTHTGYLVNLEYVYSIEKNDVIVKYGNIIKSLPVSRGRMKDLNSAYQQYIRGVR